MIPWLIIELRRPNGGPLNRFTKPDNTVAKARSPDIDIPLRQRREPLKILGDALGEIVLAPPEANGDSIDIVELARQNGLREGRITGRAANGAQQRLIVINAASRAQPPCGLCRSGRGSFPRAAEIQAVGRPYSCAPFTPT